MYYKGDKVVYKRNTTFDNTKSYYLTVGKTYTVFSYREQDDYTFVINDKGVICIYPFGTFMSVLEYRKLKLKKICSKLVI